MDFFNHYRNSIVADWVAALLAVDPEAAVVVLGDLNELGYATPVRILEATPLEDLTGRIAPDDRYTFVFNGNSQLLDHVLVSPGLDRAADLSVDIVHLNADKAEYGRASDHDPIVVEVGFTKP